MVELYWQHYVQVEDFWLWSR